MKAKVIINLDHTLNRLNLTRNKVAVEAKIPPATLHRISKGESKSVTYETASSIMEAIYELTGEVITFDDIVKIEMVEDKTK